MGSAARADAGPLTEQQRRFFIHPSPELRDTGTEAGEADLAAGTSWNLRGDRELLSAGTRSLASAIGSEADRISGIAVTPGEVGEGARIARESASARTLESVQAVRRAAFRRAFRASGEAAAVWNQPDAIYGCISDIRKRFEYPTGGAPRGLRPQWDPSGEGGLPDLRGRRTS